MKTRSSLRSSIKSLSSYTEAMDQNNSILGYEISQILSSLCDNTKDIPMFVENSPKSLEILRQLFAYAVGSMDHRFGSLSDLIVENLDSETIWEELQCRNRPHNKYLKRFVKSLADRLKARRNEGSHAITTNKSHSKSKSIKEFEDVNAGDDGVVDDDNIEEDDVVGAENEDDNLQDDEEEDDDEDKIGHGFGNYEDNEEGGEGDDDGENMEDLEDDYEDDEGEDGEGEEDDEEDEDFDNMEDEPYDSEEEDEEEKEVDTPHHKRQKRLQEEISEIEKEISGKKSWELIGEVKSSDRPQNSLLSTYADIERVSKPAPVITQEFTTSIEDLIKKRITSSTFDNVVKPTQVKPQEASGNIMEGLSTEKSSLGLGDVRNKCWIASRNQPLTSTMTCRYTRNNSRNKFYK
jgi:U3 small nucleolar RNA-associated protein MPP10